MITLDEIFADDHTKCPEERSLPWAETRGGMTVIVEPKPHWASDMRAFRSTVREYCYYADWIAYGDRARFYGHVDTSGDDIMMKARAMIAREIADGLWGS